MQSQGRFVWPPRPVGIAGPGEDRAQRRRGRGEPTDGGWRGALREIERVWLGLEVPPLPDRIAEAGWAPDLPDTYCGRCGRTVGPHEATAAGCSVCRGRRLPWEHLVRLGEYRGLLRQVIHEVKFTRWRRLGHDIGRILGSELGRALDRAGVEREQVALAPVPASWWRRIRHGIDHSLVVARGVAAELGVEVCPLLTRSHRPSQTSVPASERRANVAGSIRARRGVAAPAPLVVVIDDVTTTRATLLACCGAIRKVPQVTRVWAAVLSVTPEPRARPALPARDPDPLEITEKTRPETAPAAPVPAPGV